MYIKAVPSAVDPIDLSVLSSVSDVHCGLYRHRSYQRAGQSPSITPPLFRLPSPSPTNCFSSPIQDTVDTAAQIRSEALSSQSPLPCPELPITDCQGHYCDLAFHRVQTPEYVFLLTPCTPMPLFYFRQNNSLHRFVGWSLREGIIFFAL